MTSKINYQEAFVWIWLPGESQPTVAGKLEAHNGYILFNYGKHYLEQCRDSGRAISLYEPELPTRAGVLPLLPGLSMPNCIRDAGPDAWGRRVIINKLVGSQDRAAELIEFDELTYLLESGSDRVGALDFQLSRSEYIPRYAKQATLEELLDLVDRIEKGVPLTAALDQALFHASSIGGARPKAFIDDKNHKYIAKFSSSSDLYSVVKAEFVAMRLAALIGLQVAAVKLVKAVNKDVLLIERFDRVKISDQWTRKAMVSALTLFGLDEMMARYASYEKLAEIIRQRFVRPKATLHELFSRLVFNILCGNTDDHARNHAAFWDGKHLELTPAYDICPQGRAGNEASQAMLITGNNNLSQIKTCLAAAQHFLLSPEEAQAIYIRQKQIIIDSWASVCDEAELSLVDRNLLWGRQFLNPFALWEV